MYVKYLREGSGVVCDVRGGETTKTLIRCIRPRENLIGSVHTPTGDHLSFRFWCVHLSSQSVVDTTTGGGCLRSHFSKICSCPGCVLFPDIDDVTIR